MSSKEIRPREAAQHNRRQHFGAFRPGEYEEKNENLGGDFRPHYVRPMAYGRCHVAILVRPRRRCRAERLAARRDPDGGFGLDYDLNYSSTPTVGNVNLTGSPDYGASIVYVGERAAVAGITSTRSSSRVRSPAQAITALDSSPVATFSAAVGQEVRLAVMRTSGCAADAAWNSSRRVQPVQHRVIDNRQNQIQYNSRRLTIRNSQKRANGQVDPTRLTPRTAVRRGDARAGHAQHAGADQICNSDA